MPGRPGCHGGRRRDTRTLPLSTTLPEEDFVRRNSGSADSTILPTGDDYVAEGDRAPSRAGRGPLSSGCLAPPIRPKDRVFRAPRIDGQWCSGRVGEDRYPELIGPRPARDGALSPSATQSSPVG